MHDDVETPAQSDAVPDTARGLDDRVERTLRCLCGWGIALALSACGGGGSDATPPAAGASAPPVAASGVTISGPDGAALFVPDGATSAPVTFRIARDATGATPLPSIVAAAGDVYAITPSGSVVLNAFITARVPIDPAVPADAPLAVAQEVPGGVWVIDPRATRQGSTLEIESRSAGLFRVVRLDRAAPSAARAGRVGVLETSKVSPGFDLSAPGFRSTVPGVLANGLAYPGATTLPVTLTRFAPANTVEFCPKPHGVVVQQTFFDAKSFGGSAGPIVPPRATGPENYDLRPATTGQWTFDLRLHSPLDVPTQGFADVAVDCDDGIAAYRWAAGRLNYGITRPSAVDFAEEPVDVSVALGQTATFRVRVFGGPPTPSAADEYRVLWERRDSGDDDAAVWRTIGTSYQHESATPADEAATFGRAHVLALSNTGAADNGARVRARACYAAPPTPSTNAAGESCTGSAVARLTVAQAVVAPAITSQPASIDTLIGQTASFSVGVAGTPAPSIQWQVLTSAAGPWLDVGSAGANWPGATPNAPTLVTPVAGTESNGWLFRAVVANAGGSVTSDAAVWRVSSIAVAPTFTVQPVSAAVTIGTTALFAAAAEGTAPLSYQWTKDGVPIGGATSPVLTLVNVQPFDLAGYRLVVSGPGGSATSNPATLSESAGPTPPTPPLVSTQPSAATVPLGMAATFRVAVSGNPSPACQWTRNGIVIPGAASCDSYATPPTTAADNGAVYNVVATNAGGSVFAGGAVLTVQGIVASSDWTFLPTGTGENLYDIAIVGGDPKLLVAVGQAGSILRSTDGGASWTRVFVALSTLYHVRFLNANVGVAAGVNNIARTVDGGATWETVWYAPDVQATYSFQSLHAVDWVDANTAIAIGYGRVWRSTDRGATWSVHGNVDFVALGAGIRSLRFDSGGLGLAASDYRLFRTTDAGLTWTEIALPFSLYTNGLAVGSTGQDWVMVGAGGMYRSVNAGLDWAPAGGAGYLLGIVAHGSRMTAVGDNGLVMSSNDDGASWATGPTVPFGQLWGVDFAGQTTFVAGSGGVLARHD